MRKCDFFSSFQCFFLTNLFSLVTKVFHDYQRCTHYNSILQTATTRNNLTYSFSVWLFSFLVSYINFSLVRYIEICSCDATRNCLIFSWIGLNVFQSVNAPCLSFTKNYKCWRMLTFFLLLFVLKQFWSTAAQYIESLSLSQVLLLLLLVWPRCNKW